MVGPESLVWNSACIANEEKPLVRGFGDRALFAQLPKTVALVTQITTATAGRTVLWIRDERDDFRLQCVQFADRTNVLSIAGQEMCSASKAASAILLLNSSFLSLAKGLISFSTTHKSVPEVQVDFVHVEYSQIVPDMEEEPMVALATDDSLEELSTQFGKNKVDLGGREEKGCVLS